MSSAWVEQMFTASQQVNSGGVVRRATYDVERLDALDEIIEEARERGFHVLETGNQIVLLAHAGAVTIHC